MNSGEDAVLKLVVAVAVVAGIDPKKVAEIIFGKGKKKGEDWLLKMTMAGASTVMGSLNSLVKPSKKGKKK